MWNKLLVQNLTVWTAEKSAKLHKCSDNIVDIINSDPDKYSFSRFPDYYWETLDSPFPQLPSGVYRNTNIDHNWVLVETTLKKRESYVELDLTQIVKDDFKQFLSHKHIYEELGADYRRGVLLYGPPGTGKSFLVNNIISDLSLNDAIVIFTPNALSLSYVENFRLDNRLKIIVFEEFTNSLGRDGHDYFASDEVLDLLDGETTLDNTFVIATTNYPEKLPKNLVERPGRLDKFYKIGYLTANDIKNYLNFYNIPVEKEILDCTELTIAQLKEIIILTRLEDLSFKQAIQKLEDHRKLVENEFQEFKGRVGFTDSDDD